MCFRAQHDVNVDLCAVQSSGAQQGVAGLEVHSSYCRANNGEAIAGALWTKGMKLDPSTKWWQNKCLSAIHHGSFWSLTHFKSSGKTLGKRADCLLVSNRYIKNWVAKKGLTTALYWNLEQSKCLGLCHHGFRVHLVYAAQVTLHMSLQLWSMFYNVRLKTQSFMWESCHKLLMYHK